jgi:predicted esterase
MISSRLKYDLKISGALVAFSGKPLGTDAAAASFSAGGRLARRRRLSVVQPDFLSHRKHTHSQRKETAMKTTTMPPMRRRAAVVFCLLCLLLPVSLQARHFRIENARCATRQSAGKNAVPFVYMEAQLEVASNMSLGRAYAKAYFYDETGRQIGVAAPLPVQHERGKPAAGLPFYFTEEMSLRVRFSVPAQVWQGYLYWRAVIVFGDDKDATAVLLAGPKANISGEFAGGYNFPERELCAKESASRRGMEPRLAEIRTHTGLADYPHITLFGRLPEGIKRGREARGVLCVSLLANHVSEMRMALERNEAQGEFAQMLRFADREKLIVVCWGSRNLWDASRNWDELKQATFLHADRRFDRVAFAWESGVKRLSKIYDFEAAHFLLCGFSGSAQYAMRLALRKPRYFDAVFLHIPSSFDKPTREASPVLWCLATGELESGYARSQRFLQQCRAMNYRFIYKAVPGLGHSSHAPSMSLGISFFEYALKLPKDKRERDALLAKEFDSPQFWGDWLNQTVERGGDAELISEKLRVSLPSEKIASAWEMKRPPAPAYRPVFQQAAANFAALKTPSADASKTGGLENSAEAPPAPANNNPGARNKAPVTSVFGTRIQ